MMMFLIDVVNSKNKDFYEKYKKDVQFRIDGLTNKFEYCLEYKVVKYIQIQS